MKILKYLAFILVPLILIYLLLCFLGPKNSNLTRSIEIETSPSYAFNMVNDLNQWSDWSAWVKRDTSMEIKMSDKSLGLGAAYAWTSEVSGNGNMEIIESVKNQKIKTKMIFDDWGGYSYGDWAFEPIKEGTRVSWSMSSEKDFPYLMRGVMLIMRFKKTLKNDFDNGLANLKELVEKREKGYYGDYLVVEKDAVETHYILSRAEIPMANIKQFYGQNLGVLFGKVQPTGIEMNGMPSSLVFKIDELKQTTDMAVAIPVKEPIAVQGTSSLTLPANRILQVDYFGDFSLTANAHTALKDYMKDRSLLYNYPIIEENITDPGEEPDPAKWLTRITYYLAESE